MTTANDIITDALQELIVQASEAPIEAPEAQTAIRYLNRMMFRWSAIGIDLGYTTASDLGDDPTLPAYAEDVVVKHLAALLMKQYDIPMTVDFKIELRDLMSDLRLVTFSIGATEYGSTLPYGSGNETVNGITTTHFYPDLQDDILTETTGSIGLEADTASNT